MKSAILSTKEIQKPITAMSKNMLKDIKVVWNPSSGGYMQPPESIFGKLYCRKIEVYPNSRGLIKHIIGKGGKHFYHFTSKHNLVYIYYHDYHIEVWGNNKQRVHDCIHEIIAHMKEVRKEQQSYKKVATVKSEEVKSMN